MAKYLAQIVIMGAQVVGRAFTRALKQELAASQTAANQRRSNNGSGNDRVINAKLGMSFQEALQILNIETEKANELEKEVILSKYNHLFDVNDKSKGGSFYLQSKKCVQNWKLLDRHWNAFRTVSHIHGNQSVPNLRGFATMNLSNGFHTKFPNNVFEEALNQQNIENCLNVLKSVSIVRQKKGLARIGRNGNIKKAAVLVPFCRNEKGEPSVLLTQRSNSLSYHRGEVCFPGGVEEAEDNNEMIRTAVRETVEELGIDESRIKVYGVVNPFPSSTNSHVYPVLGFIDLTQIDINSNINREEVENVFVVPLKRLCEENNWRYTHWKAGWVTPVYRDQSVDIPRVWGLTSGILYAVLSALLPNVVRAKERIEEELKELNPNERTTNKSSEQNESEKA